MIVSGTFLGTWGFPGGSLAKELPANAEDVRDAVSIPGSGRSPGEGSGHEFEQGPGVGDGQGSLECCSPWVAKSWTWLSDWTVVNWYSNMRENNHSPGGKQRMVLCCKTPQLDEDWLLGTGDYIGCAVFLGALVAVQLSNLLYHPKSHKRTPMKTTPCFWGWRLLFTDVSAGIRGCKASALFNSWFWQDVSG